MSDQIKIRIGLEGDADVTKKLDAIKDVGKKTGDELSKSLNESVSTGHLGSAIGAEENLERSRVAAERFREVVHTLHPILDTAGLGLGNLGALARVAGAGMGALAAAIIGSVVVGLGRLADQTAATKKQLDDLSSGHGGEHFAGLRADAKRLGTDVDSLVPAYKQALGLRNDLQASNRSVIYAPGREPYNLPGGPLSDDNLHKATSAVQSLFAAGKAEDPAKASADFFTSLRKSGGRLTPEALQGAAGASEGAANKIAQSLPEGFGSYQQAIAALQSGRVIDRDELFRSLAKAAPQAEKAAQAVRGLKEAIDGAIGSSKKLGETIAGENLGKNLAGGIDKVSSGIDQLAELNKEKKPAGQKSDGNFGNAGLPVLLPGFGALLRSLVTPVDDLAKAAKDAAAELSRIKSPNERVAEEFNQLKPKAAGGTPSAAAPTQTQGSSAAAPSAAPTLFNDDGSVNPYTNPEHRTDGYTHPFAQAPNNEAERRQQIRESAVISKKEAEFQNIFNQNTRDQNGGSHPSPDKDNYAPPIHGHYDPESQKFVANRKQPARDPNAVPGAPQETTFPGYQRQLIKEFRDKYGPSGNPAGVENPTVPEGLFTPGINPPSDPEGQLEPAKRIYITKPDDDVSGYAAGGHIRGPGSSTSDSIPAMLSDGEYVVKADAVKRMGVDKLDAINSGAAQFADGGQVQVPPPTIGDFGGIGGNLSITYDPLSGGAYINGVLHRPGDPILNDPRVKKGIEQSKKSVDDGSSDTPSGIAKAKKDGPFGNFSGNYGEGNGFAEGGLVGSAPSIASRLRQVAAHFAEGGRVRHFAAGGSVERPSFADHLSAMGLSSVDIEPIAIGGMPEMPSADLSKSALQDSNSNGRTGLHPVTMNFPWGGSIDGLHAEPDAMRQLSTAAQKAKRYSTGPKPAWYGGKG